ncbi:MAG: carboxylesterase family protein [Butyrivibrio sp.]|nr:carboxylesterase family protein [Butyrivibrio sp.]
MKNKKNIGFIVVFSVAAVLYILALELSKNTLWGWALAIAALTIMYILYTKFFSEKKWYIKVLSFICMFVVLFGIYRISYPPYRLMPAVSVKNPGATEVIRVAQGELTGVYNADNTVEVFTGIPYAKPPVGELRWKEPQEPESWEGVRVCDHFAPRFMQPQRQPMADSVVGLVVYNNFAWFDPTDNYQEAMSEDALYLNVWKPEGDVSKCPVLFYIHGGSLQTGSPSFSHYNGEAYAKRGIVFVDFGYRLNIFGYFADEELAEESANNTTGNYGLLDQIQALKWVHENISAFGGDPDNITIAGESAGSSSVNAICVSPLAKGLFRRAIGESSGICTNKPFHTFRPYDEALEMKKKVYDTFGAGSIEELRSIDAKELVKAAGEYNSMTVDGYAIPRQPAEIYRSGENNEEALLNGYNAAEADVFTLFGKVTGDNYAELLKDELGDCAEQLVKLYPPGDDPKAQYDDIMSAAWFSYSHYTWSRYMAKEGRPVFEYYFTKDNKGLGTNHAGELPYFYGNLASMPQNFTESDYELSETIMDYIENYVRTGNPNKEGLPKWDDFSEDETRILELGSDIRMVTDVNLDIYQILDTIE